ncbi:MAG: glucosidase [Desulfovermiculus sp.]|nr:glucosidase [Desulfovermiculus sp.]
MTQDKINAENKRLQAHNQDRQDWKLWGPYVSERAWGTVREDYSPNGQAWEYFSHDQARSQAYRWNEDGLGGICDRQQRLCLGVALWNGQDPILKERMFGLTANQGNHGEEVKEIYHYLDATPSHSLLRFLYKYPQQEFPYARLVEVNQSRSRTDPPYGLLDTKIFEDSRYWDVEITYAKKTPHIILLRIKLVNQGPDAATLHILPSLWFRNTWSWGRDRGQKPVLQGIDSGEASWAVQAKHPTLGQYLLYGRQQAKCLFTENETNLHRLFGVQNPGPYVKDAFHRRLVQQKKEAVNPDHRGTKCAAWHEITCAPGQAAEIDVLLTPRRTRNPWAGFQEILDRRRQEADRFYQDLAPACSSEDSQIMRQAMAGMIWCTQYYHYDVRQWLEGDLVPPPEKRTQGRNRKWRHLRAADIISMPDSWEYPWFAAWDLAYHCMVFAHLDVDLAKEQVELLLGHRYLHPNGQLPAYEWALDDVNPPIHALSTLKVFRAEGKQRGSGDLHWLRRTFHKLTLNYAWWLNQKDNDGLSVFEGGFMGLDNISVYDRSRPLPAGFGLKQADATGWMAMFALNMTGMALELARENSEYEDMAIQYYEQFLGIANSIAGHAAHQLSLWDPQDGFFKDLLTTPDGQCHRLDVYSYVGLIPLFACEIVTPDILEHVPRFQNLLHEHSGGMFDGHSICACPIATNEQGERLLSLVDHTMLPHILRRLLSEDEFLSKHGIRSVSRIHAHKKDLGNVPGIGQALIAYEPGESQSGLFGGNSNWRGPVWMPINYSLIQALTKFHRYLGPNFTISAPSLSDQELNLSQVANLLAERLINIFRRDAQGQVPGLADNSPYQNDALWTDLRLFPEYFHGETGLGLGAAHQTGWTGLVANLIKRRSDLKTQAQNQRES